MKNTLRIALCLCSAGVMTGFAAAQQYDAYIWQTPQPHPVTDPAAQPFVDALREAVDRILNAGYLRPCQQYFADGVDGPGPKDDTSEGYYLYHEPGRILRTLASAWPYLDHARQQQVMAYVRNELAVSSRTPWASNGALHPYSGSPRNHFSADRPWGWTWFWNMIGTSRPRVHVLYGLWLYAHRSGDWGVVSSNWAAIKSFYTANAGQGNIYGTMGSHIAMARMAERMNDTAMRDTAVSNARTQFNAGLNFSAIDSAARAYYSHQTSHGNVYDRSGLWPFINMVPEVGRYITEVSTSLRATVVTRHNQTKARYPVWWMYRPLFYGWTGSEGVGVPSEIVGMVFPVERWVVQASSGVLAGYKIHRAQYGIGDCYTIEAIADTISSFASTQWVDVRTSSGPGGPFAPVVALTSPVNGSTFTAPATIVLAATASDIDGTIARVEFWTGATQLNADTASPYAYNWTGVAAGSYALRAIAYDNTNTTSTSTVVNITVITPNQPPVVTLTSPVTNSTYTAPATLNLAATASDPDGTIANVRFYRGTTLLNTDNASPYEYTWTGVSSGTYQLRAVAQDNQGVTSTSTVVTVTVLSSSTPPVWYTLTTAVNPANGGTVSPASGTYLAGSQIQITATPNANYTFTIWSGDATGTNPTITLTMDSTKTLTANFTYTPPVNSSPSVVITHPADGATYSAPADMTIRATATDTDGTITVVRFYHGTFLLNTDSASPYEYTWTGVPAGSYILTAQAEDNRGAVGTSAAVGITVSAQPVYYTLTVTATPAIGGTVAQSPTGTSHLAGTQVSLTATPNAGYEFAGWTGDITGSSTTNPMVVVMDANKTLTANFRELPRQQPELSPGEVRVIGSAEGYINATHNPNVTIRFRRTIAGVVTVRIYDLRGRLVMERTKDGIADEEDDVTWNIAGVPSGVYVVRVTESSMQRSVRVAVVR